MAVADRSPQAVRWLSRACRRFLLGGREHEAPLALDSDLANRSGAVERLAAAHGVEPLLHALVSTGGIDGSTVPEPVREGWLAAYCLTLLTNRRRLQTLGEAFALCRDRSLDLVALKGPVHIARVYGDAGLRPMVDLDLLCREEQLAAVVDVFHALGYSPSRVTSLFHLALHHREHGEMIELHFDLYELLAERRDFLEGLFASAVDCEVAGTRLRAAAREPSIVVDLAHLVNHDLRIGLRHAVDFCGQLLDPPERAAHSASWGRLPDRELLRQLLTQVDLVPEHEAVTALLAHLLELGPRFAEQRVGGAPPAGLVANTRELWERMDELGGPPLLSELSYRRGLGAKFAYLRRLLGRGLAEHGANGGSAAGAPWARHVGTLLRKGWRKLRRGGIGSRSRIGSRGPSSRAQPGSLKREVYRRRA
jgi:hypothetical protein